MTQNNPKKINSISQTIWVKSQSVLENKVNSLISREIHTKWIRFNGKAFVVFLRLIDKIWFECEKFFFCFVGNFSHYVVKNGNEWRDTNSGAYQKHFFVSYNRLHWTWKRSIKVKDELSRCHSFSFSFWTTFLWLFFMFLDKKDFLIKFACPIASNWNRQCESRSFWFDHKVSDGEWMPLKGGNILTLYQYILAGLNWNHLVCFEG